MQNDIATANDKHHTSKAASSETTYRLGSSGLVFAPGLIAWAINGYAFKKDRKRMEAVLGAWPIPLEAIRALLSKSVPYTIEDAKDGEAASVVVFTA